MFIGKLKARNSNYDDDNDCDEHEIMTYNMYLTYVDGHGTVLMKVHLLFSVPHGY